LYLVNYRPEVPEDANLWSTINKAYSTRIGRLFAGTSNLPGSILSIYGTNPYIMHGVTFTRLVDRVWLRIADITDAEKKKELLQRFKEEVDDGKTHCTNGMMVRMSNVFLGFDDNIVIKLNPNQILGARIPATQERLRKSMDETAGSESTAFWLAVYNETIKDLEELEVDDSEWDVWLTPLAEPVLDELFTKLDKKPYGDEYKDHLESVGLRARRSEIDYLRSLWPTS
jgi:hypothetical protein